MDNKERKHELAGKGVMGLMLGISLMAVGLWVGRQLHIVWSVWPSTDGEVVRGAVEETLEIPYSRTGMPFHRYTPKVEFRYFVGSTAYTTEAISVHSMGTFQEALANVNRLYAPGTHHPIRYNPREPRDIRFGVIEFAPLGLALLFLFLGAVVLALGLNWFVLGFSRRAEPAPAEITAKVLSFAEHVREAPSVATVICPGCGRSVKATEDNCPNCLKALRAA